jgi:hypothetical protein
MSSIASLIVKIGADKSQLDSVLAKAGESAQNLDATLKKLGNTPIGQEAVKSAQNLEAVLKSVTDQQQKLADRAKLAATGLEALGGPAKLTTDQLNQLNTTIQKGLDAFRALGQDVPPQLQKVAAAVQAQQQALTTATEKSSAFSGILADLGNKFATLAGPAAIGVAVKSALDYADSLTKMSDKTGVGVVALQRLQAIAGPSGNSIEDLAGSINKFQKNLVEGNKDTEAAIRQIGLSVSTLRSLSPDEQFIAIAKGIQTITDPAEQATTAVRLFGKEGAEVLPSLKAKVDELAKGAAVMSAESVRALNDFGGALGQLKTTTINFVGDIVGQILRIPASVKKSIDDAKKFAQEGKVEGQTFTNKPLSIGEAFGLTAAASGGFGAQFPSSLIQLPQLDARTLQSGIATLQDVASGARGKIEALTASLHAQEAIADHLGLSWEDYRIKLKAADHEIASIEDGQFDIFRRLDANTRDYIETLIRAGVSQEAISVKFDLTSEEVKALTDNLKNQAKVLELEARGALTTADDLAALGKIGTVTTAQLDIAAKSFAKIIELERTVGVPDAILKIGIVSPNAERGIVELTKRVENLKKALDAIKPLDRLAQSFATLAQISNGSLNGITRNIGGVIASVSLAEQAFTRLSAGIDESGKKLSAIDKLSTGLSGAAGVISGAFALESFVSGIVGLFQTPEWKRVMDEVARDWGAAISQGTAQGIADTEAQLVQTHQPDANILTARPQQERFPAELINLKPIISDAGGLNSANLDKFIGRLHDVFSALAQGQLTAAQAAKVLDDNFQSFVDAGIDKVGLLNSKLVEIIKLNDQVGLQSKEIQKFVTSQISDNVFGGITKALTVGSDALNSYDELNQKQLDLRNQLSQETNPKTIKKLQTELDATLKKLDAIGPVFDATKVASQAAADAFAGAIVGGIAELEQQGVGFVDAIKQAEPAIDALRDQLIATGFDGGAAFQDLVGLVDIANNEIAGPALRAVDGLGQALRGLSNTGLLTQDEFTGLGDQVAATFASITAQGIDGDKALRLMQPTLQTLYELQQQFGFTVDEATQKLIDQGVQSGIVGEKQKTVQQQTLDVLKAIATTLGATLPEEAEKGAAGIKNAFTNLQIPPVHVPVVVDHPEIIPPSGINGGGGDNGYGSTGGLVTGYGIQHFATGGRVLPFRGRGTDTVLAGLTPGEIVLNEAQQQRVAASIGGVSVTVDARGAVFTGSPAQWEHWLDKQIAPYIPTAIHKDMNGIRKVIKKVAAA